MLVFIDESGHPHLNDAADRPVVVSVCIPEKETRRISARLHGLKQQLTGRPDLELKAQSILNRATFRRQAEKRELVEAVFEQIQNWPITVFAILMERPTHQLPADPLHLPNQFRYLLQRAHHLAVKDEDYATILFDGDGSQAGGLAPKFECFIHRRAEGAQLDRVADAPYFVDSRITAGIQLADLIAGAVRIYEENELYRRVPEGDAFLSAVARYYRAAQSRTIDLETPGGRLSGFYRMPERAHYRWDQEIGD